jgi:hypothetical protein
VTAALTAGQQAIAAVVALSIMPWAAWSFFKEWRR